MRASKSTVLVATIPESDIEIGGEAGQEMLGLCCKPDVGVSQIRTTTVLSSCFCVGQTVL